MAHPAEGVTDEEATVSHPGAAEGADLPPDLPDAPPDEPQVPALRPGPAPVHKTIKALAPQPRPGTETQFAVASMDDGADWAAGPQARLESHRSPAPARQRPTLLPASFDQPPKLPGAPRTVEPGLMRPVPVRQSSDGPRLPTDLNKESSDVINTFDMSGGGEVKRSTLHAMAPARTHAPGGAAHLQPVPLPPPASRAQARRLPTAPPAVGAAAPRPVVVSQGPLPLNADVMVGLIAAHRAKMATLDLYARGLEICAFVLGTCAAGFLIATLVALLVSQSNTLLAAAAALVTEVCGVALAVTMLALATALRHMASSSAQQAALLEALSSGRS